MTSPLALVAVILLAVLVGAAIPVLYQMYRLLVRARAWFDITGPRLDRTLDQVGQAADRINGIGSILEAQAQNLRPLLEGVATLGRSIDRSGRWLDTAISIAGAAWPALVAGVRAFMAKPGERPGTAAAGVPQGNEEQGPDDERTTRPT